MNPKQTSLTLSPSSLNLQVGSSQQITATGNFDDGSTKNQTGSSTWTSADPAHVTVNSSGLVTGVTNTTSAVTITATNGAFSGTSSVTVGATTITITCNSCTNGNTISIASQGTNPVTFTASVASNWSSSNSNILAISTTNSTTGSGTLGGGTNTGTVTITATAANGSGTGSIQITVTQ